MDGERQRQSASYSQKSLSHTYNRNTDIKDKQKIRNSNIEIRNKFKIQMLEIFQTDSFAVILSEAKNLIIRRPDPSASPQDDTKCHFSH